MSHPYDGVLVVDKPSGMSSYDVIRRLQRRLRMKKMGHTGTLDPAATGVLVVCLGFSTRWVPFMVGDDKGYSGSFALGAETDTDDADGQIVACAEVPALTDTELQSAMKAWTGEIAQVPPSYSAIQVDGKRAYKEARAGRAVALEARQVTVHRFDLMGRDGARVDFAADVSKGTYIRALARDVGRDLGCGAHLTRLRRERVGAVTLDQAQTLDDIAEHGPKLVTPWDALAALPVLEVTDVARKMLRNGLKPQDTEGTPVSPQRYRIATEEGGLLGVVHIEDREGIRRIVADRLAPQVR